MLNFFFGGGGQSFEDFRLSQRVLEPNPREKRQMTAVWVLIADACAEVKERNCF